VARNRIVKYSTSIASAASGLCLEEWPRPGLTWKWELQQRSRSRSLLGFIAGDVLDALFAEAHPGTSSALAVGDQAKGRHGVDEHFRRVELPAHAELRRGVVERVLVVPVVPALANGHHRHEGVLGRPRPGVVRVVAHEVGSRVHAPREVEHQAVAQGAGHPHRRPEVFAPAEHGHVARKQIRHVQREPRIQPILEHDEAVGFQIAVVKLFASLYARWQVGK